jgi:hypothetical protein
MNFTSYRHTIQVFKNIVRKKHCRRYSSLRFGGKGKPNGKVIFDESLDPSYIPRNLVGRLRGVNDI